MFRVISATALAAGLLFAAPVAAEPFDTFHDLCFATHGDRPAAHAEAKRRGWAEIPTEALGDMAEEMFRELVMHTNFNPDTGEAADGAPGLLLTGWGDGEEIMGAESVVVEICSLMSPELELEDAEQRLTALVGARAVAPDEEKMWLYSRVDGRYVSEAALQEFAGGEIEAVARQRDLYVAFAMEDDGARVLMLGAVRSVLRLREGR